MGEVHGKHTEISVWIRDVVAGIGLAFKQPLSVAEAWRLEDVRPTIRKVEQQCQFQSLYAVGFVCYEAAASFDPSLDAHAPGCIP